MITAKKCFTAGAALLALTLVAVELPSVTYIGRITNAEGIDPSLTDSDATIRLLRTDNQHCLAQSAISALEPTRYNYRLYAPMTDDTASTTYGKVDLAVAFQVTMSGKTYTSSGLALPQPGTLVQYDLAFATDANQNGVADAYEEEMELFEMPAAGVEGPYDADADYDGDGMSNRDEYYAGTDPLNAADRLAVVTLTPNALEGHTAVEFIISQGHSYGIKTADSLADGLTEKPFRVVPQTGERLYHRLNVGKNAAATATVYLLPEAVTSKFIRVMVDTVPLSAPTE